jgi:hypothetical protein
MSSKFLMIDNDTIVKEIHKADAGYPDVFYSGAIKRLDAHGIVSRAFKVSAKNKRYSQHKFQKDDRFSVLILQIFDKKDMPKALFLLNQDEQKIIDKNLKTNKD